MKSLVAITLFAFSNLACAEEKTGHEFLSWYDGWGSHLVWRVGSITGSYATASVKCGKEEIKVVPIYDTHTTSQPPGQKQSSAFARAHNIALAQELAKKGIRCAFGEEPSNE